MRSLELIEAHPVTIGLIVAALGLIFPAVRKQIAASWNYAVLLVRAPGVILQRMDARDAKDKGIDEWRTSVKAELEVIRHELEFNGGESTKDFLKRMEAHRRHDLWTKGAPVLETDEHGNVVLVSQAACRLFQVSSEGDLKRLNWLRYLDGEQVSEFITSFREMAAAGSGFNYRIQVYSEGREDRGEWEVRAVLIGPRGSHAVYSAQFYPMDAAAKEIAGRCQWAS